MAADRTARWYVEALVAERAMHTTAEQVQTTCSFARAERLLGREYHGRFLIELLQNAADAWRKVAEPGRRSRLKILVAPGPRLVVANQGDPFPARVVIESLGHIGRSTKPRGEAIGHKGIGFKSVLELSLTPELYSGLQLPSAELAVRFDPDDALEHIRSASPDWDQLTAEIEDVGKESSLAVPVLRFPQWVDRLPEVVLELAADGFDTVVILPFDERFTGRLGLDEATWLRIVRDGLSDVTDQILLLLGTFDEVRIEDRLIDCVEVIQPKWHDAVPIETGSLREIVEVQRDGITTSRWRLYRRDLPDAEGLLSELAVGMRLALDEAPASLVPPLGDEPSAPFHLFFPTKIGSGLPLLLHGYFEVDAARTGFYEGSGVQNDAILAELAHLVAEAVTDAATDRALDLASLVELLATSAPPEDRHARRFRDEALDLLDRVEWVPLEDDKAARATGAPVQMFAHAQPELIRHAVSTFGPEYIKLATGLNVPARRISAAGLAFIASRHPREGPGLWDLLGRLLRPGEVAPWPQGTEDNGFRKLLDLIAALDATNRLATNRLLEALRGDPASRLLPVIAARGERALMPLPNPAEGVAGSRSLLVMARVRSPGESTLAPPKQLDVAFLPDGLLENEAQVDRAKPLGVRPFTVDNVLDRLSDLSQEPEPAEEMIRFLWSLLTRERRSELGTRSCVQRAETFDPAAWFWCQPGRGDGGDSDRDRQRREHLLAGVPIVARDGTWRPAGTLAFGDSWAAWLESGVAGPLTPAVRARIDAYRALERLHPDDGTMLADPAVVLPLLDDQAGAQLGESEPADDDVFDGASLNAERHAFLLRLGVWEVVPVEGFDNRTVRDRTRFPWTGPLNELQRKIVADAGGWTFESHRWSGGSHQNVYVAEDYRFRWALVLAAQRDPISLARSLGHGVRLFGKLLSLSVFCPGCTNNSTRHQPPYRSSPHDNYPSTLRVELQRQPWVASVRNAEDATAPLPPDQVWWAPKIPTGAGLLQSPLRFLTLCHPDANIGTSLRDLARIHEIDGADVEAIARLLRGLRAEFVDGTLPSDPLESSSARQAFVGLHRLGYERLAELAAIDRESVCTVIADIGVLCEVGEEFGYYSPTEARHDDGKFASYRRYFAGAIPFVVLPRDKATVADRLGLSPFTVSLSRRGEDDGRDVTDELSDFLGDRIAELLAIVVHHSLGAQTLEPTSQQFEDRARRLRNFRVRQVDSLIIDAAVDGTMVTVTIGERTDQDVFLEGSTSSSPTLFHDFAGEGWQDRLRRKLAPHLAAILENPAYSATFALFLLADDDADREATLQELGISMGDIDGIRLRVGAVSEDDRRRHRRWFSSVIAVRGKADLAPDFNIDALHDDLVAAGFPDAVAARLVDLGGGVSVRRDATSEGALSLLAANGVELHELDASLRAQGDDGLDLRVARDSLRQWVNANGRRVAAVLALTRPPGEAKAAISSWHPPPHLMLALDPDLSDLLVPVVETLRAAGFEPDVARLATHPASELARLADLGSTSALDALVEPLYDEDERQRILRASAAAWRRELLLLGVVARVTPSESRAVIRSQAAAVDELLPTNPSSPSTLLATLDELFGSHPTLVAVLAELITDSYVVAVPDRQALLLVAQENGLTVNHLDVITRALDAPRRDAARQTHERVQKLVERQLQVKAPPGLQPVEFGDRQGRAGRKKVAPIKIGEGADRRKRHLGDEGERWALAALLRPFLHMNPMQRREAIDGLLELLDHFEGTPVEAVRAHAEPACAPDLDDEELIDELTAFLHVSRYSDAFGFDLLGWLPPSSASEPGATCLEVKSSRDGTFHFSTGEWSVARRFHETNEGDRYAVLVVRRAVSSGPPAGFDLLADPVELANKGLLAKADDGYKLAYRAD